jgi:hypothetical protein
MRQEKILSDPILGVLTCAVWNPTHSQVVFTKTQSAGNFGPKSSRPK